MHESEVLVRFWIFEKRGLTSFRSESSEPESVYRRWEIPNVKPTKRIPSHLGVQLSVVILPWMIAPSRSEPETYRGGSVNGYKLISYRLERTFFAFRRYLWSYIRSVDIRYILAVEIYFEIQVILSLWKLVFFFQYSGARTSRRL